MRVDLEKLKDIASDAASVAHSGLSSVHAALSKASSAALAAGQHAQDVLGDAMDQETQRAAMARAKDLSASAATEVRKLADRVVDKVKEVDARHKDIADKVETVSMGLGIVSGVATAGAAIAAPTGLTAVGVALGITSAPLIVTAAPVIGVAATVTGVVSGGAYFYSMWRGTKSKDGPESE